MMGIWLSSALFELFMGSPLAEKTWERAKCF